MKYFKSKMSLNSLQESNIAFSSQKTNRLITLANYEKRPLEGPITAEEHDSNLVVTNQADKRTRADLGSAQKELWSSLGVTSVAFISLAIATMSQICRQTFLVVRYNS